MASNFNSQQRFSSDCKWSLEYDCAVVNGILAPVPLSVVPLETEVHYMQQQHQQSESGSSSKRSKTTTTGVQDLSFRLFKFLNAGEQYVLETHEVKTGVIGRFHLKVIKGNDGWKVKSYGLANTGHHNVCPTPMLEDPVPLVFRKICEFSLQERLIGWTVEHRKRVNGRNDAFYYHRGGHFRSFTEMASFILYSSSLKELELINNKD